MWSVIIIASENGKLMWEVHINVSQIPMKMRYAVTSPQAKAAWSLLESN
jgi:hypothetical protein